MERDRKQHSSGRLALPDSISIIVDTSKLEGKVDNVDRWLHEHLLDTAQDSAQVISNDMYWRAPFRNGMLAASISIERQADCVLIGPTVPYAYYVTKGTQPSPGRYVPAIGKRLVNPRLPHFGMHPGIRANPYIAETVQSTREAFAEDLQRKMSQRLSEM